MEHMDYIHVSHLEVMTALLFHGGKRYPVIIQQLREHSLSLRDISYENIRQTEIE